MDDSPAILPSVCAFTVHLQACTFACVPVRACPCFFYNYLLCVCVCSYMLLFYSVLSTAKGWFCLSPSITSTPLSLLLSGGLGALAKACRVQQAPEPGGGGTGRQGGSTIQLWLSSLFYVIQYIIVITQCFHVRMHKLIHDLKPELVLVVIFEVILAENMTVRPFLFPFLKKITVWKVLHSQKE